MVPVDARGGQKAELANRPGYSGVIGGVVLLLLVLPCLFGAYVAFFQSQHNRDAVGWTEGLTVFLLLTTVWLAWAGVALTFRRPPSSLRAPGIVGVVAATVGLLVNLQHALAVGRMQVGFFESRALLFVVLSIGAAAAGNVLAARGSPAGRLLHWLSPLGALAGIAFVMYETMRVAG